MNVGFITPTSFDKPVREIVFEISFSIYTDYFRELSHALLLKKVRGFDFIRAGRDGDGGYLLLNNFKLNEID